MESSYVVYSFLISFIMISKQNVKEYIRKLQCGNSFLTWSDKVDIIYLSINQQVTGTDNMSGTL